jgi:hypothetical protein
VSAPILSFLCAGGKKETQATDPYQGPFLSNLKPRFVTSGVGFAIKSTRVKKEKKTKSR